ncbi:MAG: valine--tRNA ligase [Buchnera aphidicola (Chaetogeoica yunlongensis)]
MKKHFNPLQIENKIYTFWEKNGYFKPDGKLDRSNFCIVIPPPNITGNLHLGHAFQQTIMDILIRYNRMQGKNTFWQVGTDHAGIATQILVEKKMLHEEKKTIRQYSREIFLEKIWEWKNKFGKMITHQMRTLGISVDWTQERFTLDAKISYSVRKAFIILYKENLIYKRKKLVNWDPILKTVISDLEVEHRKLVGKMWYIKYSLLENNIKNDNNKLKNYIVVSTTRPETLFGDTAIAVNPGDNRYKKYIGKKVLVPIINRIVPVVGDEFVDPKKGTGCVKITPAHDFDDYKVAIRHKLPIINILKEDGTILNFIQSYDIFGKHCSVYHEHIPKKFHNLDRLVARDKIVETLISLQLLEKIESHDLVIPYGERSGSIIEPFLTDQWYLNVTLLSKTAIKAVKNGDIVFIPKKYEKIYYSWMNNIQDWCISRQLIWGHRIPIWYDIKNNIYVGHDENDVRKKYSLSKNIVLNQENDVLDTWFSSSLWVLSSLGWPNINNFFNRFYPTNVIVSGFDIIFFWIARMIMLSMHMIRNKTEQNKVPFKKVYITGLICDENGQKMSKSKGNVIDPLDMIYGISLEELIQKRTNNMMISRHVNIIKKQTKSLFPNGITSSGTDALRFTCAALSSPTRYIKWNINRLYGYRNFCNKLWNASRFVLMNINKIEFIDIYPMNQNVLLSDKWIIVEFNVLVKNYRYALDNYRFDLAANMLYEFIWNKFCDIYLELSKPYIVSDSNLESKNTKYTLVFVLESILRLAHPIIPFITEEIWQKLKHFLKKGCNTTIMLQSFPEHNEMLASENIIEDMDWIKNLFLVIKQFRKKLKLPFNTLIPIFFKNVNCKVNNLIEKYQSYIKKISYLKTITIIATNNNLNEFLESRLIYGAEVLIPYSETFSKELILKDLEKEIFKIQLKISRLYERVQDQKFINQAPNYIIDKYKKQLTLYKEKECQLLLKKKHILKV